MSANGGRGAARPRAAMRRPSPARLAAVREAVLATLAAIAPGIDVSALRPDQPLRGQLDLDSLDWLNAVAALRDRLGIDLAESDIDTLATLDAAVAYLATRKPARKGEAPKAAPAAIPATMHDMRGFRVKVRAMHPTDIDREATFVRELSDESRYKRFMTTLRELSKAKLETLTRVDQVSHVALVATVGEDRDEAFVGVARYIVDSAGTGCEFAIAIGDDWQGSGLAGILMQALIDLARARGLATMEGVVLAANSSMLQLARQLGFEPKRDPEDPTTIKVVRSL